MVVYQSMRNFTNSSIIVKGRMTLNDPIENIHTQWGIIIILFIEIHLD